MSHFRRVLVLMGIMAIFFCGCGNTHALRDLRADQTAAPPEELPTRPSPTEDHAPLPPPPRPPAAQSELDRIPKIEPVTQVSSGDAGVSYFSSAALPKIIAFYQREMKDLGWKSAKTLTDHVNYANLDFSKGNELLIISLGLESGSAPPRVMVSLTSHGSMKVRDLPRYPGTKTLAEFDHTAVYLTADSVAAVLRRTIELLRQAGWRERREVVGGAENKDAELEKGQMLLGVYISMAPAQGNQTTIQYNLRKKND